jgi:hypothetical protein
MQRLGPNCLLTQKPGSKNQSNAFKILKEIIFNLATWHSIPSKTAHQVESRHGKSNIDSWVLVLESSQNKNVSQRAEKCSVLKIYHQRERKRDARETVVCDTGSKVTLECRDFKGRQAQSLPHNVLRWLLSGPDKSPGGSASRKQEEKPRKGRELEEWLKR